MSEESNGNSHNDLRFPCGQTEYMKTVGELLPTILSEIFIELGFRVNVNHQQANGVDLEIFRRENLVLVVEVLNWSIGSRLTHKRKGNIIRNLNEFSCNKLLIHTIPLANLDGIEENGIDRIEIGYQILPEEYYNFYLERHQIEKRAIDSDATRREIRAKILRYIDQDFFECQCLRFLT